MSPDRVLVTGASGLVGANIVRDLLEAGYPVRVLVRDPEAVTLRGIDVEVMRGDVRDSGSLAPAMDRCRYLVHAAALYNLAQRHSRDAFATNVAGTRTVMEAALAAGIERIVYTSSVSTIGAVVGRPGTEDDHATLRTLPGPYERSKFVAERLIDRMVAEQSLPAVIVNPSTVIGAFDSRPTRTGQLILDAAKGRMPAYVDTGLNVIAAVDVAAGHRLALEKGRVGRRYILGNENLRLRDLLERIDRAAGRSPRRVRLPHAIALGVAYVSEGVVSRITRRDPLVPLAGARLARHYMYSDPTRARTELGLPATPIDDAIDAAMRWFSVHNYL